MNDHLMHQFNSFKLNINNFNSINKKDFLINIINETNNYYPLNLNLKEFIPIVKNMYKYELHKYLIINPKINEYSSIACHLMNLLINFTSYDNLVSSDKLDIFILICDILLDDISKTLSFGCFLCFSNLIYDNLCKDYFFSNNQNILIILKKLLNFMNHDCVISKAIIKIFREKKFSFNVFWDGLSYKESLLLLDLINSQLQQWRENIFDNKSYVRISYADCHYDDDFHILSDLTVERRYIICTNQGDNGIIDFICFETLLKDVSCILSGEIMCDKNNLLKLSKIVECIAEASLVQEFNLLLKDAKYLKILIDILHLCEKLNSMFNVQKFSLMRNGIKAIANLVYNFENLQNLLRNTDSIPILLNATKLNATNPVIQQWSILALRNICENNEENCEYIRKIRLQQTMPNDDIFNKINFSDN